jgi:hypothetical protein
MTERRRSIDRIAGRIYTRMLAVFTGLVSLGMLIAAVISWAMAGPAAAWMWLLGTVVFGLIARMSWRSRAALSDIDFTQ